MSLESATYINQLVRTNPNGSDPKGQGDDHLRLIKGALLNTFPNVTGPITASNAELNALAGGNAVFKRGMVIMWGGDIPTIPPGWLLCNGTAGTPNLLNRFVVCAGGDYGTGVTGGQIFHSHGVTVNGTALTVDQLPPHVHGTSNLGGAFLTNGTGIGNTSSGSNIGSVPTTGATGSGAAHAHSASSAVSDGRPPYYALAYIMKA